MSTVIIGLFVLILCIFSIRSIIRDKKEGKSSSGCEGCSSKCSSYYEKNK